MKNLLLCILFFVCALSGFSQVIAWDFNKDGSYHGWTDFENRIQLKGKHEVRNGALAYTIQATINPQWRIDAGKFPVRLDNTKSYTFEIKIRRTAGIARARTKFFVNLLELGVVNLENHNEWQTITFDYIAKSIPGRITSLRFDPAGGQNGSWEIDAITVTEISK